MTNQEKLLWDKCITLRLERDRIKATIEELRKDIISVNKWNAKLTTEKDFWRERCLAAEERLAVAESLISLFNDKSLQLNTTVVACRSTKRKFV